MPEKSQAELVEEKTRAAFNESGDPTPDAELAEEKRRAAVAEVTGSKETNDRMIAALRRERAGLEQQGKTDRVKEVDEQLAQYGYKPDSATGDGAKGGAADARKQAPQGRSNKPQQTTD